MKRWYAYPHFNNLDGRMPFGRVEAVEVLHQEENGTAIVKYESGHVSPVGGVFSLGRLFDSEAAGWQYCAEVLRAEAAKLDAAAAECAAKGAVEVAA